MSTPIQHKKKNKPNKVVTLPIITHKPISNQQLEKEIQKSNYQYHKANVIIRKKQTKTQLA